MTAVNDAEILSHYKINDPFPSEWPAEKDQDDSSDDEPLNLPLPGLAKRKSKSRYSAISRNAKLRGSVPGAEVSREGKENLVQKDEADPLGGPQTVIQVLRRRGLPVEDDVRLRNRFLLSSTTFAPSLFLSQVHNDASTESLLEGLDFLSRSIEQKSASLKVLVQSNFERFVRAKATIDNVYKEMRRQGPEAELNPDPPSHRRRHSRQLSKSSGHFRKTSGPFSPTLGDAPPQNERRKNALVKESEYGVLPIKDPLNELAIKVAEVWGPAIGGREKEDSLKVVLGCVEKNRGLFELGSSISDCIKRKDHETLVEEYLKARKYANDARAIVDSAVQNRVPLSDPDVHQVIVTARMWADVEEQVEVFKRDIWRRLAGTHFTKTPNAEENKNEEHMELIGILLELGVTDNPIWIWLISRYDFLKKKMTATFERSRVEIEILRRRLSTGDRPSARQMANNFRAASADGRVSNTSAIDSPAVIEVWEHIYASMNALLSTQGGVLGELVEYWETAQGFIDGQAQRSLPTGIDGNSRKHHRLSVDGVRDLAAGALELVNMLREDLFSFFSEPPIDDLSMLLSPLPPMTPDTPSTPKSATLSAFTDSRFRIDPSNLPPPSPRSGESWEKYGFWPPHANSLSGAHYLSKILVLVGTAATEMASLSVMKDGNRSVDNLKTLVGGIRERCVQATCAAWNQDAEHCRVLEDWTRAVERHDLTNMPAHFMSFEGFLLSNLQKILYVSEATRRSDSVEIIVPPSQKLLQMVRSQFVSSIYKSLTVMVENAERPSKLVDDWEGDRDGLSVPEIEGTASTGESGTLDSSNKKIRILVTLSNVQALRNDIVPHLISQFENYFSVKLTDETKDVRDVLAKIDSKLFQAYTQPIAKDLEKIIQEGINSPTWAPECPRPTDARPYVYSVLLSLVLVHTEVSTTASPLTAPILKHLLEAVSGSLIDSFKQRPRYSLPALMQATLDVEFLAQTMNQYTTEKAADIQSAIYVALDERTDNEARLKLQDELQEMRGALKRLREATKVEFVCFKRQRGHTVRGENPIANR
ncbi:hypothetical protein EJ08DRAFT_625967 [Tothia fuscella]|uniref:Exocyst complex component SEC5 n=1 Tax=Tothia fuscella TaxID=1048955 RepID=A0A9P4P2L0_9PEZI|nr:hypothetical protein EJ08DRAFT_625967 [Tothia fuscella]